MIDFIISKLSIRPWMLKHIKVTSFDGINHRDYPDYCDAFIDEAYFKPTGTCLTVDQLTQLQDDYSDWVYEELQSYLY